MAGWLKNKFKKLTKSATKTASNEAKKEIKKSLIDLVPGILGIGAMILGIFVFNEMDSDNSDESPMAMVTKTTTNNYFFGDISDDLIMKILEDD